MNHAITLGGLLFSLSILVGLAMAAVGALVTFAAGMSDTNQSGGWGGCAAFLLGIALFVGGIWGLLA